MEKDFNIAKKAEEFLQMFKRGEEFTKDLLKENENSSRCSREVRNLPRTF
jgi:hypothetical protein